MIVQDNSALHGRAHEGPGALASVDHTPIVTAPAVVVDIIREAIAVVRAESRSRSRQRTPSLTLKVS